MNKKNTSLPTSTDSSVAHTEGELQRVLAAVRAFPERDFSVVEIEDPELAAVLSRGEDLLAAFRRDNPEEALEEEVLLAACAEGPEALWEVAENEDMSLESRVEAVEMLADWEEEFGDGTGDSKLRMLMSAKHLPILLQSAAKRSLGKLLLRTPRELLKGVPETSLIGEGDFLSGVWFSGPIPRWSMRPRSFRGSGNPELDVTWQSYDTFRSRLFRISETVLKLYVELSSPLLTEMTFQLRLDIKGDTVWQKVHSFDVAGEQSAQTYLIAVDSGIQDLSIAVLAIEQIEPVTAG